jgi:putative Holliday junction resolvase
MEAGRNLGRILGLDFGLKRVGAALSDPRKQIATPLEVYQRRDERLDARHYRALVEDEDIERLVVGLPVHTGGGESDLSALARRWGAWLSGICDRSVVFQDERYTSADADAILRESGQKVRDRKARRDMLAAQILLQRYLDAGCPESESAVLPLLDEPEGP